MGMVGRLDPQLKAYDSDTSEEVVPITELLRDPFAFSKDCRLLGVESNI